MLCRGLEPELMGCCLHFFTGEMGMAGPKLRRKGLKIGNNQVLRAQHWGGFAEKLH